MDLFRDLFENNLHRFGFAPVRQREREGQLFALDSEAGQGRYWVYACDDLFAVSEMELTLCENFPMDFEQPADIQIIAQYGSAAGVRLPGNRRINPADIREYLPCGSAYQVLYGGGRHIHGTSITLHPAFCEEYLQRRYPGEAPSAQALFRNAALLPELTRIMREINCCRGTGLSAKLYYESKVLETLSLLMRQTGESRLPVTAQDVMRIEEVKLFIGSHYGFELRIDPLARLACMSPTKFKSVFKASTGFTVAGYITQIRMETATRFLQQTDLTIAEIAHEVGYKKAGAFSEAYRAFSGYLPGEMRKGAWR